MFRPRFWVFHVALILWLCRKPIPNVQIPRDFSASTEGPIEPCPGFSRGKHKASICNAHSPNNELCDLPKLCPRDRSWGTVWRISSVCESNPARPDCKMRYRLSTLFASACYTSSRQALRYWANTTDSVTTVAQTVFDVPNRALWALCCVPRLYTEVLI